MRPGRGPRVLVLLFLLSTPLVTTRLYGSDEIQWFSFLRSLWFDQDLNFDNEYRDLAAKTAAGPLFYETFLEKTTVTGYRETFGTIGCAILWAPFYAVGDVTARVMHALGSDVAVDGYSKPYIAAVCYGSAFYGFAAILIAHAIARRLVGGSIAADIAVWIGTPLFFYMYISPIMAHACSAFCVSLFVYLWLAARERWATRDMIRLGAAAGLMVMVREQDLFFVAGPAVDLIWTLVARRHQPRDQRGLLRPLAGALAAGAAVAAVVYLPQILTYLTIHGHIGPADSVANKMAWGSPYAFSVLFSTRHGLVFWTPLVVVAFAGLLGLAIIRPTAASARAADTPVPVDRRRILACVLVMVVLQVYIAGAVKSWTVSGAFGQRRFISLTPLLILGLAALFHCARRSPAVVRATLAGVVVLCVWWNVGLTFAFGAQLMDRKQLTLECNVRTTFVYLPTQAPGLAWRYLTNRESFYRQPRALGPCEK